jgi:uncharacterized membrane protein YqaE (UPF0057 family)
MKKRDRTLDEILADPHMRWQEAQRTDILRRSKRAPGRISWRMLVYGALLVALYALLVDSIGWAEATEILVSAVVLLAIYLVPAYVASRRGHHQRQAILVLNLLLGWTALGWIAALVWAMTAVQKPV